MSLPPCRPPYPGQAANWLYTQPNGIKVLWRCTWHAPDSRWYVVGPEMFNREDAGSA